MAGPNLASRLAALEAQLSSCDQDASLDDADDADAFLASIHRIAERYSPEAAETPRIVREGQFSPAQRLAWALRFGTDSDFAECLGEARAMVTA